jgi:hypothetical protein
VGLVWWSIGIVLVTAYFVFAYSRFAGKVDGSATQAEGAGGY